MIYARHSVLKRGCSIWDRKQMPEEEFHERLEIIRRQMAGRGLDALVIYGDTWAYADLCYPTNYFPKVRGGLAIIPRKGPLSLHLNIGSRDVPFAKSLTWVEDVRASGQVGRDAAKALKELGLEGERIGLVDSEKGLPLPQAEALKGELAKAQWEDSSPLLLQMRLRKSKRERGVLEEAGSILREICQESKKIIRPGKKEYEVISELDRLARNKGVEDMRILIGDEKLKAAGEKEIDSRQSHMAVYFAIQHRRYWAETGRTYMLREDSKINELHQKAEGTLRKMAGALSAGKSMAEISEIARQELGEFYPQAITYGLGNGIGLSQWEAPFFAEEHKSQVEATVHGPSVLQKDMVVALRVAIQAQGKLVLAGNSYEITPNGPKVLTA